MRRALSLSTLATALIVGTFSLVASSSAMASGYSPHPCGPNQAQNYTFDQTYYFDGWDSPSSSNIDQVSATLTTYSNFVSENSYTADPQYFNYEWVMLTTYGSPYWVQIGYITGPLANLGQGIDANWQAGDTPMLFAQWSLPGTGTQEANFGNTYANSLVPGNSNFYEVQYDASSKNFYFYFDGNAVGPAVPNPTNSRGQPIWTPTQAQIQGETHSGADQMFGDVLNPAGMTSASYEIGSTSYSFANDPPTSVFTLNADKNFYPNYEAGWQQSAPNEASIWANACPRTVYSGSSIPANGLFNTLDSDNSDMVLESNGSSPRNGPFYFESQTNGAYDIYETDSQCGCIKLAWVAFANFSQPEYMIMQPDGNLVVYNAWGHNVVWDSGVTGSNLSPYALIQSDGNLVVYGQANNQDPLWSAATTWASDGSTIEYGDTLVEGQSLSAGDGSSTLVMQTDGNLVQYSSSGAVLWSTGTWNGKGCPSGDTCVNQLDMQTDGNLVLYSIDQSNGSQTPLWSTGTQGSSYRVTVNGGGTFSVYNLYGGTVWTS